MKHILFTLKGCPFDLLDDEQEIKLLLYRATEASKSTLLNLATYKFDPQGVTGFAMLAESHISIHTWPEKGIAVCDVFTCGDDTEPQKAVEYMKEQLKATNIVSNQFERPLE